MTGVLKRNYWWNVICQAITISCLSRSELEIESVEEQYFRVQPEETRAQVGSEVTLLCEIDNLKGRVQWSKDGFALGYVPEIPGFPRYRMLGDFNNGVFNLHIHNVNLEDDALYECQVGPYRAHNQEPVEAIRASANLTVLSPPSSVEMIGHPSNSKVDIHENKELTLECRARNSKPAARIVWYRGKSELKLDNREDKIVESNESNLNPRTTLYDVISRIKLRPSADDDDVEYSCEAQHDVFPSGMALRTSVQLSVLYPPGEPFIEGYDPKRDTIRRGQTVELACRSRGGNPLAQLVWYRNGEEIQHTTSNENRMAVNVLTFKADTKDNNATYTCKASSVVEPTHIKKTETRLTVNYAPLHVIILGSTQAKVDDVVSLNCTAGPSNPAATIRWLVDGRQMHNNRSSSNVVSDPENGWITSSTISIPISVDKTNLVVICHGTNSLLNENVVATHNINVLYPPGDPIISGYESGKFVESGVIQRLVCKSSGGNPLANLTWFKNDKEIHSITKTEKTYVFSELHILVNSTDNGAEYKCVAKNDAIEIPKFHSVKFNVYFSPDTVVIRKEPKEFRAGTVGKLICDASSSNPEANLTFWRNGIEIESVNRKSKPGLHGGNVTTVMTVLNVTADMDANLFTCQAQNSKLGRSSHAEMKLSVLYKPAFIELNETVFTSTEGESLIVPLRAEGHPSSIMYTWSRNGVPLQRNANFAIDGPTLNITKVARTDAGVYTCEASNSEGSSLINFTINVHYSAVINEISNVVMVGENEDAELWCKVDAVPLSAEHVTWSRPGFSFESRTIQSFVNNTFQLTVRGVTRKDMGQFYCVADNGLGNETSRAAYLVVKHKPEIDQSPVWTKAASNLNATGRLICRASGAPKLTFSWSQDGHPISVNTTPKYQARFNQLDAITYESILTINRVEVADYGAYHCKANNALGSSTTSIHFSLPSRPDPPIAISVVNSTHDAITIAWIPGFDGGIPAKYRIRYRDSSASGSHYKHVEAGANTVHTVAGLQLGTAYVFSVLAYNRLGDSDYVKNTLRASTSNAPTEALLNNAEFPLLFIFSIAAVAVFLLLVNICILTAFFYRRRKFEGMNEQSSNKSGTIEMYAPSSYNETVTGETLSSVSEKSETYSDTRQDYDEKKRNGGNAYLIEQIDYPFQYPGYDTHPKEHNSIGHHRNPYITHNGTGYQSENSSRYSSTADPRYVTYPPPVQFAQPTLPNGTLRHGMVPPPDVTVLTAPPPVSMSTFNYNPSETEGHLV